MQVPRNVPIQSISIVILIAANILLYQTIFAPKELTVTSFEVGKGSATLVRSANGKIILIDTGSDASILRALGKKLLPWQRTIDIVLLTSASADSAGGLPEVLNRYRVLNIVRFGGQGSKSLEAAISASVGAEAGLKQMNATESQRLNLGDDTYIDIVISPTVPASVYISNKGTVTKLTQ